VAFSYEGVTVVSGLDFSLAAGDYLCVVGENGSGKSTLVKGLLGLLPPSAGSITLSDTLRRSAIGYLPQQTAAQSDFPSSVFEVVLSGRLAARGILPFFSRADKAAAESTIRQLGIAPLRNQCYRELSGGQQQRVLLARALCAARTLLLLDEPVAGLDPVVTQELYALVEAINREQGMTVVMVSHDVRCAVQHASHMLHLKNSQLFFGTTSQYLASSIGRSYCADR
jgi:zinc transport system ATP-binding protein